MKNPLVRLIVLLSFAALVIASPLYPASAVAYGKTAYGFAYNFETPEEAEAFARKKCEENGGEEIEIIVSSHGFGYGAIATDGNIVGAAVGFPTIFAAIKRAKMEATKLGAGQTKVVATWFDFGYKPKKVKKEDYEILKKEAKGTGGAGD